MAGSSLGVKGSTVPNGTPLISARISDAALIASTYCAALNQTRATGLRARTSAAMLASASTAQAGRAPPSISTANANAADSVISPSAPRRKTRMRTNSPTTASNASRTSDVFRRSRTSGPSSSTRSASADTLASETPTTYRRSFLAQTRAWTGEDMSRGTGAAALATAPAVPNLHWLVPDHAHPLRPARTVVWVFMPLLAEHAGGRRLAHRL